MIKSFAKYPIFFSILLNMFCQYLYDGEPLKYLSTLTEQNLALLGNPLCWKFFF